MSVDEQAVSHHLQSWMERQLARHSSPGIAYWLCHMVIFFFLLLWSLTAVMTRKVSRISIIFNGSELMTIISCRVEKGKAEKNLNGWKICQCLRPSRRWLRKKQNKKKNNWVAVKGLSKYIVYLLIRFFLESLLSTFHSTFLNPFLIRNNMWKAYTHAIWAPCHQQDNYK